MTAVATAAVPKFTVLIGGSLRRGQLRDGRARVLSRASCGRGRTRASRSWAARRRRASCRRCREASLPGGAWASDAEREAFEAPILETYEREGSPYFATARLWDDGIIDPLDTRRVLSIGLEAALHAPIPDTKFGVFRM